MKKGDVVVAIPASGDSKNLVKAVYASGNSGDTVRMTSFEGGYVR